MYILFSQARTDNLGSESDGSICEGLRSFQVKSSSRFVRLQRETVLLRIDKDGVSKFVWMDF